jgi:hypothetical protein
MNATQNSNVPRTLFYVAMVVLLIAIFIGAYRNAPPIYLAVGFLGEVILVATAHLSSMIEKHGRGV